MDPDGVLLQLLVLVGLDLLNEMGVHVLDVPKVGPDAWVHRRHYLVESKSNYYQKLFLIDFVVRILGLLALVLLDEGGVDALGVAEAMMHQLYTTIGSCIVLSRLLRPLLRPQAALLIIGSNKGGGGDFLVLRLVRHGVEGAGRVSRQVGFPCWHHSHHFSKTIGVDAIHVDEVVMYVVLRPRSRLALLVLVR